MSMSEETKQNAWAEHNEKLLNVEFDWDPDHLSNKQPLEGQPIPNGMVNLKIWCLQILMLALR